MMTKKKEREALDKIEKIIASLDDENSYVRTAFDGCIQIAEQNIADDSLCSFPQRLSSAQAKIEKLEAENKDLSARHTYQKSEKEFIKKQNEDLHKSLQERYAMERIEQKESEAKDKRIEELEKQIIALKAKCFDLMVAQHNKD